MIARAMGEGDHHKVKKLTTNSLTLSLLIVGILIVVGLATIELLFSALGTKPEVLSGGRVHDHLVYGDDFSSDPDGGQQCYPRLGKYAGSQPNYDFCCCCQYWARPHLYFWLGFHSRLRTRKCCDRHSDRTRHYACGFPILHFPQRMLLFDLPNFRRFGTAGRVFYMWSCQRQARI